MKKTAMVLLSAMLIFLTACGSVVSKYDTNTLVISKNGIQDISIEDYSGIDVTKEDLQSYIEEQISAYQTSGAVVLDELTLSDQIARLALTYDSIDTYNAVNGTEYTLISAKDWEYKSKDVKSMVSLSDGALEEAEVKALLTEEAKVLVLTGKTDVVISGTILAYTGAEYVDDSTLHADDGTIIIYK